MNCGAIDYLEKGNRSTIISSCNEDVSKKLFLERILDDMCVVYLSTASGRIDAVRMKYGIKKLTPIYVYYDCILQPLFPRDYWRQVYINVCNIDEVDEQEGYSLIKFLSGKTLKIEIEKNKLENLVKNCLKIKNDQFNIGEENIYNGKEKY